MSHTRTNNRNFGASEIMGPLLRKFVESQLVEDLIHYKVFNSTLFFDWTNSCAEGHSTDYLDGILENFSYISVFDAHDILVAEGWIDFIDNFFDTTSNKKVIVYWDLVTIFEGDIIIVDKSEPGIPEHIWETLDDTFREIYKFNKQKKRTIRLP